jgi:hypothetical protein
MDDDKLAKKAKAAFFMAGPNYKNDIGAWGPNQVDKLSFENHDTFVKIVKDCRFFFRHEPIATTVVTKMVGLAMNDIIIPQGSIPKTDYQIYDAIRKDVIKFLRKAAIEFLTTGLVVPEITLETLNRKQLREKGIQRLDGLLYPTKMWLRNSQDIVIKRPFITDEESYFLLIPDGVITFLQNKGTYDDGSQDKELYLMIVKLYPDFVAQVLKGETRILLDNPLIIKSTILSDSQYPIPYLYPGLESYKHKRNLKRMDYSIASRVISAILHVTAGNDDYPLTEDQEDFLDDLENKFHWREGVSTEDIERVFTLFTNHTVKINWIFPDVDALLDDKKYDAVNKDIILALGFPRILITGETERSFTSDPEIATLSPESTMNVMRDELAPIIYRVFYEVHEKNNLKGELPEIKFKPINLLGLRLFHEGLIKLYDSGNLSRASFAEAYGYDISAELNKKVDEKELMKELGLDLPTPGEPPPVLPGAPGKPIPKPAAPKKPAPKPKAGAPPGNDNGKQ